jgi:hypothetical protein
MPEATPEQSRQVRQQTAFIGFVGMCIAAVWISVEFIVYLLWPHASDTVRLLIFLPFAIAWLAVPITRFRCPVCKASFFITGNHRRCKRCGTTFDIPGLLDLTKR